VLKEKIFHDNIRNIHEEEYTARAADVYIFFKGGSYQKFVKEFYAALKEFSNTKEELRTF